MPKHGIIAIAVTAILMGLIGLKTVKVADLTKQVEFLTIENEYIAQTLKKEQDQFKATVDKLQKELSNYVLDADAYQCVVARKAKDIDDKAKEEESKINKELQSDSSSDNQLNIARRILDGFNSSKKD